MKIILKSKVWCSKNITLKQSELKRCNKPLASAKPFHSSGQMAVDSQLRPEWRLLSTNREMRLRATWMSLWQRILWMKLDKFCVAIRMVKLINNRFSAREKWRTNPKLPIKVWTVVLEGALQKIKTDRGKSRFWIRIQIYRWVPRICPNRKHRWKSTPKQMWMLGFTGQK